MKSSASRNSIKPLAKRPAFVVPVEQPAPESKAERCDCAPDEDSFHPRFRQATDNERNR